ncbi:MAG: LysE family translocator [Prevotellaceae bacterium]|jgi:threonine/homoserine/homoserine lactone efflux protein|nr:LysE family translocator [Prevotellaceae bacterium]
MFELIWTGILIGIFVSAPVGPIGILCIQRTLHRGRLHGIATGLGAAASDLIYAVLTALGMGSIISFVELHQLVIQIVGSAILFLFGLYTFRRNPVKQLRTSQNDKKGNDYFSDFVSAFGLCFSNPLIILLFIGLFARFHFLSPEYTVVQTIVGLSSVLIGAGGWWLFLTLIVGYLRNQFNVRGLWILNRITGSLLILFSVAGVLVTLLGITL